MQFARLRLNGFKSFVDPTDLVIAPGLTGVVGPNGCGKSNLLEALRWVMGENRPSAMRGGGMEDVIFAGAATRPARNFAEVALSIDNSDRLAPAAFNDSDTLEVVRRITRDAGSAYKVNGKDVRARDVQMLFADASTGAHSPALVRQGQIAELINAKPKARRRILEEAAGISGLYQRRHEAELKLKSTETNLARVDDVLEQLAQQLAQLARQARQAARYRAIATELRQAEGMLLYRRWREAADQREAAEASLAERLREAARAEVLVREAARAREAAEAALPPLREEEAIAAALVQRLLVERDTLDAQEKQARARIETLEARIAQLGADMEREAALGRDAEEMIERLTWEAEQLAQAAEGHDERLAEAQAAAHEAASVLEAREEALAQLTEDVARLAARHQSALRLVEDNRAALTRANAEADKARAAVEGAREAEANAEAALREAQAAQAQAEARAEAAEAALIAADGARAEAQAAESEASAAAAEAEGARGTLAAEVAALERLLERDSGAGTQLIDRLTVAPGYEKALGAALADELRASVVESSQPTGWVALPPLGSGTALPEGAEALSYHVEAPKVLARRLAQVGVVSASQGAELQPLLQAGQRLVSREGDLWRWDGYRIGADDASSTAGLRLEQMNRLAAMKHDLEEAEALAREAAARHGTARKALADALEADRSAREERRAADQGLAEASRAVSRSEADRNIAEGRLETACQAVRRHEDEAAAARARLLEAERDLDALADLDAARAEIEDVKLTVEAARMTMLARRSALDEIRREGEARTRRSQQVTKELSGWKHRHETAGARIADLESRRAEAEGELEDARTAPEALAARRDSLSVALKEAEARKARAVDAVSGAEGALRTSVGAEREAERTASAAREERARAEARLEAARDTVAQAEARIAEELETEPAPLRESLGVAPEDMPEAAEIEHDVNRLKRQRDALGAVNLRAEEDAREVQEEHDALAAEKADLEAAVAKLRAGISGLNREGRERLLTAFEQVNSNFGTLFAHLFGGGEARLVLVESDDPLEAGLEIMCQPPGKKLSTLSLLSGGEQTLTALALIFAVFLANPAPICVLDEVDAPLDDANVTRFCDMLDEMTRRTATRFLVITHHAVTMSRMDRLFGVTMAEHGVSQLVSVDLKRAESMVA